MVRFNGEGGVATMAQPSDPLSFWLMDVASIRAAPKGCASKYRWWLPSTSLSRYDNTFLHGSATFFFPHVKGTETTDDKHRI
jgi:hypothetical protein